MAFIVKRDFDPNFNPYSDPYAANVIFNNTFNTNVNAQNTSWYQGPYQQITNAPAGCSKVNCLHLSQGYTDESAPALYSQQGFGYLGMLNLTQSYTIECWFYVTDINTDYGENGRFLLLRADGGDPIQIWFSGNRSISVFTNPGIISTNSSIFNLNSWNHLAVTVNQSSVKTMIYINGINRAEANYTTNTNGNGANWGGIPNAAWEWGVGHDFDNGYDVYISNMRWTQVVRYTSNFTPTFINFYNSAN